MDIINPIPMSNAMLTSSTLAETVAAWAAGTSYPVGAQARLDTTHRIYQCVAANVGSTGSSSVVAVTIAAPAVVSWAAHGLPANAPVTFSTTGYLPSGIVAGATYYVSAPTANTFSLAASFAGAAVTTTGTQSGAHTCISASNSPDVSLTGSAPYWVDVGATNKYACIDEKYGTQSTAINSLTIVLTPGLNFNSLALLNMLGASATVTCTVPGLGITFTKTVSLYSDIGVADWYGYFFAPIAAPSDVSMQDIPPYASQVVTITISGAGTVAIGNIILGTYQSLGLTRYNAKVGISDYSTKAVDIFGNATLVKRPYSKTLGATFEIARQLVDNIAATLATIRSTPIVWVGVPGYGSTIVFGYFKDFEVDIAYPTMSICTITIEGLT